MTNKTVLSKVVAIEKVPKSRSLIIQIMQIQIKIQRAQRSPKEILKREGACWKSTYIHKGTKPGPEHHKLSEAGRHTAKAGFNPGTCTAGRAWSKMKSQLHGLLRY